MRTLGRCAIVALIAAGTFASVAAAGGIPLNANLTGTAVVPGPGDPDGSGFAAITLNSGQGLVCFDLAVADISPSTAAHIHKAAAGSAGPVAVSMLPPIIRSSSGYVC